MGRLVSIHKTLCKTPKSTLAKAILIQKGNETMKTKEDIYDEQIKPLMHKIYDICKENRIAMLAQFSIPGANDPAQNTLQVMTSLLEDDCDPPQTMLNALEALRPDLLTGKRVSI